MVGRAISGYFMASFTVEQSSADYYEIESDPRGIESDGPLTLITSGT